MKKKGLFGAIFVVGALSTSAVGCASCQQSTVCSFRDTINAPENRTMRRSMLEKGIGDFCQQMLQRNAPLKLDPNSPVIGRFYPQQCTKNQLDNGDLDVTFAGYGYAFTNVSKKMTFTMSGTVEYDQDFLVADNVCEIYAYFRTKNVASSNFKVNQIELQIASFLNSVSPMADNMGKQLVAGQLAQGFTVIHGDDGDDFSVGIIPKNQPLPHPFNIHGTDRITYENARVEVHQNERDFIGPISIDDDKRALFVQAQVDGAPAIDVLVMRKQDGDASLNLYFTYPQIGPLSGQPLFSDVAQATTPYSRAIPLPKGMYYVILDNSAFAGATNPPNNPLDDRFATVSYAVQIGDAP